MFKFIILAAIAIGFSNAYDASPAIATTQQNTYRSYGNLGQISTFSKALDSPFSSVHKSDVRISNPGIVASPTYLQSPYASPISPLVAHGLPYGHGSIVSPSYAHGSIVSPSYAHGPLLAPSYAHGSLIAPGSYAHSPLISPVAKTVAPGGLLGIAYSAAPSVAHMTYSNGLGISYAW